MEGALDAGSIPAYSIEVKAHIDSFYTIGMSFICLSGRQTASFFELQVDKK